MEGEEEAEEWDEDSNTVYLSQLVYENERCKSSSDAKLDVGGVACHPKGADWGKFVKVKL